MAWGALWGASGPEACGGAGRDPARACARRYAYPQSTAARQHQRKGLPHLEAMASRELARLVAAAPMEQLRKEWSSIAAKSRLRLAPADAKIRGNPSALAAAPSGAGR